jgi:hypothetical protein
MNFSNIFATLSLTATQTPARTSTSGTTTLGLRSLKTKFTDGDSIMVVRKLRAFGSAETAALQVIAGVVGTVTNVYVAAVAQVETATAAGTITLAGNATVTVTSGALTGSPLAISVPVALSDTAATWAGKVRTALAANAAIAAKFTVGGSTTAISLTRIKPDEYGVANDATLNIALANGTCTGITAAPTSTNTTTGSVADGAYWDVTVNEDGEGIALPIPAKDNAFIVYCTAGSGSYDISGGEFAGVLPAVGSIGFHTTPTGSDFGTASALNVATTTAGVNEFIVAYVGTDLP